MCIKNNLPQREVKRTSLNSCLTRFDSSKYRLSPGTFIHKHLNETTPNMQWPCCNYGTFNLKRIQSSRSSLDWLRLDNEWLVTMVTTNITRLCEKIESEDPEICEIWWILFFSFYQNPFTNNRSKHYSTNFPNALPTIFITYI